MGESLFVKNTLYHDYETKKFPFTLDISHVFLKHDVFSIENVSSQKENSVLNLLLG